MEILKWCLSLAITVLATTFALREAIFLVLRVRMMPRDTFLLALLLEAASLVLTYGVGYAVEAAIQNRDAILPATIVLWAGSVVAHIIILAFRLDITVFNAIKVYLLMVVILIAVAFALMTVVFLFTWLWAAVTER
jgi:hypothetical protein